jgi:hypothetical protein
MRSEEITKGAIKRVSDEIMSLIDSGSEFKQVKRTLIDLLLLWEVVIYEDSHFPTYRVFDLKNQTDPLFSSASYGTCLRWVLDNVIRQKPPKREVIAE